MSTAEPALCPECGRPDTGLVLPPSARGRRILLTLLVAATAILISVGLVARHHNTTGIASGSSRARLVEPPITLGQVRALAASEDQDAEAQNRQEANLAEPGALTRALSDPSWRFGLPLPGKQAVEVKFNPAIGARTEVSSRGWPLPFLLRTDQRSYQHVALREGFIPACTDSTVPPMGLYQAPSDPLRIPPRPRWQWQGTMLAFQPPPEETGGAFTTIRFQPGALAVPVAMLILLWLLLIPAAALLRRITRRDILSARGRRFILGAAALALLLAGVLNHEAKVGPVYDFGRSARQVGPPGPIYHIDPDLGRLPWSLEEINALTPSHATDRRLARAILDAVDTSNDQPSDYVFAAIIPETQLDASSQSGASHAFPLYSISRLHYIRRPDFGTPEYLLPDRRFQVDTRFGFLRLFISPRDTRFPILNYSLNTTNASLLLVGGMLLGLIASLPIRILQRCRIRNRRRNGLCTHCGYQAFAPTLNVHPR